jgi:hypothetical protein
LYSLCSKTIFVFSLLSSWVLVLGLLGVSAYDPSVNQILVLIFLFYYSYVHTRLASFLPPAPTPSLTTHSALSLSPPSIPSRNYFALISNFVVERV